MKYHEGDYIYARDYLWVGRMKIHRLEYEWCGCMEKVTFCIVRFPAGTVRIPVSNVMTQGEAVAERLSKGRIDGRNVGVRQGSP